MKQYEIWWAALPEPVGRRPVLLLTRNEAYEYLSRVAAVEVTTTIRAIPQELLLGPAEGLPRACVASFDNLRSVPKARLATKIGRIAPLRLAEAKAALGRAWGWLELCEPR